MVSQKSTAEEEGKESTYNLKLILHGKPYPVDEGEGPFSNFFLDKIMKNLVEKHPEAKYQLEKNGEGKVTSVLLRNVTEPQRKELEDALEWSLRKVEENRKAGI